MSNFIKEASAELEHVVWPTPVENKKYMIYTIGVIVVIGIFLAVLGFTITNWLVFTRAQFPHDTIVPTVSGEDTVNQEDLNKILKDIKVKTETTGTGTNTTSGTTTGTGAK